MARKSATTKKTTAKKPAAAKKAANPSSIEVSVDLSQVAPTAAQVAVLQKHLSNQVKTWAKKDLKVTPNPLVMCEIRTPVGGGGGIPKK
jgi:hypothetical protein